MASIQHYNHDIYNLLVEAQTTILSNIAINYKYAYISQQYFNIYAGVFRGTIAQCSTVFMSNQFKRASSNITFKRAISAIHVEIIVCLNHCCVITNDISFGSTISLTLFCYCLRQTESLG